MDRYFIPTTGVVAGRLALALKEMGCSPVGWVPHHGRDCHHLRFCDQWVMEGSNHDFNSDQLFDWMLELASQQGVDGIVAVGPYFSDPTCWERVQKKGLKILGAPLTPFDSKESYKSPQWSFKGSCHVELATIPSHIEGEFDIIGPIALSLSDEGIPLVREFPLSRELMSESEQLALCTSIRSYHLGHQRRGVVVYRLEIIEGKVVLTGISHPMGEELIYLSELVKSDLFLCELDQYYPHHMHPVTGRFFLHMALYSHDKGKILSYKFPQIHGVHITKSIYAGRELSLERETLAHITLYSLDRLSALRKARLVLESTEIPGIHFSELILREWVEQNVADKSTASEFPWEKVLAQIAAAEALQLGL